MQPLQLVCREAQSVPAAARERIHPASWEAEEAPEDFRTLFPTTSGLTEDDSDRLTRLKRGITSEKRWEEKKKKFYSSLKIRFKSVRRSRSPPKKCAIEVFIRDCVHLSHLLLFFFFFSSSPPLSLSLSQVITAMLQRHVRLPLSRSPREDLSAGRFE